VSETPDEQATTWQWTDEEEGAAWNAADSGDDVLDVLDALAPFVAAREAAAEQRGAEKERERIATAIDAARPGIPPSTDPKRERNLAARLAYNHASRLARAAAVA
jgi:hypothetical protein